MASTYVPLATYTVPSAQASYTFSSISQAYTDLVLVISATGTPNGLNPLLELNGDTGTNYSATWMKGNGTSATSSRNSTQAYGLLGYINNSQPCNLILNIQNYSNTTTYKTTTWRWNTTADETGAGVCLWRSTAAINAVKIKSLSGTDNFATGTTMTLYGIKAA